METIQPTGTTADALRPAAPFEHALAVNVDSPIAVVSAALFAALAIILQFFFRPTTEIRPKHRSSDIKAAALVITFAAGIAALFAEARYSLPRRIAADPNSPRATDFVVALWSFAFLTVNRVAMIPVFTALGAKLVPHAKRTQEEWETKVQRFAGQLWKAIFHGAVTVAPLVILRDEAWWPPGIGDASLLFEKFPLTPAVRLLREFYMFQLGYYMHALMVTLMQRGRPNYVQMVLHHVATIALISVSYFVQNNYRLGTWVMFVHDVCDVPVCLTRLVVDLSYTVPTVVFYFLLLGTWIVFRLIVFPLFVIRAVSFDAIRLGWVPWSEAFGWIPLTVLLFVLLAMHFQWFFELLQMFIGFVKTGKREDSTEAHRPSRSDSPGKLPKPAASSE